MEIIPILAALVLLMNVCSGAFIAGLAAKKGAEKLAKAEAKREAEKKAGALAKPQPSAPAALSKPTTLPQSQAIDPQTNQLMELLQQAMPLQTATDTRIPIKTPGIEEFLQTSGRFAAPSATQQYVTIPNIIPQPQQPQSFFSQTQLPVASPSYQFVSAPTVAPPQQSYQVIASPPPFVPQPPPTVIAAPQVAAPQSYVLTTPQVQPRSNEFFSRLQNILLARRTAQVLPSEKISVIEQSSAARTPVAPIKSTVTAKAPEVSAAPKAGVPPPPPPPPPTRPSTPLKPVEGEKAAAGQFVKPALKRTERLTTLSKHAESEKAVAGQFVKPALKRTPKQVEAEKKPASPVVKPTPRATISSAASDTSKVKATSTTPKPPTHAAEEKKATLPKHEAHKVVAPHVHGEAHKVVTSHVHGEAHKVVTSHVHGEAPMHKKVPPKHAGPQIQKLVKQHSSPSIAKVAEHKHDMKVATHPQSPQRHATVATKTVAAPKAGHVAPVKVEKAPTAAPSTNCKGMLEQLREIAQHLQTCSCSVKEPKPVKA